MIFILPHIFLEVATKSTGEEGDGSDDDDDDDDD
jgi:hypothetical protein